jgi:hypothetical protein
MPVLFGRSSFNYFLGSHNGVTGNGVNSSGSFLNHLYGGFGCGFGGGSFFSLVAARVESSGEGNSE